MANNKYYYHQAVAPMLWVLLVLSLIELFVMHFLISFWSETVAIILSLLTVLSIIWLVTLLLSFKKFPVILHEDCIQMHSGNLQSYTLAISNIAGLRTDITADELKEKDIVNLALLAHPNIVIDLKNGIKKDGAKKGRIINSVAHRLDNIEQFLMDYQSKAQCEGHNEARL
jgi:hypothetical protein